MTMKKKNEFFEGLKNAMEEGAKDLEEGKPLKKTVREIEDEND
jgi:hypothetical protein